MPATFYVPSGLVCQPGAGPGCQRSPYLTLAEVRRIAADGNEIGGLSVQHVPLTGNACRRGAAGDLRRPAQPDPLGVPRH
ncbi:MAG: hypothetical protein ACR2MP_02360 [Streptosporangiaceae bacterium]